MKKFTPIKFDNKKLGQAHFDIVSLTDLLAKEPKDHSQYDFHRVTFYVIILIYDGNGIHNINFEEYPFEQGSLFTIRKNSVHKFLKNDAKGVLLVFTEAFIFDHSNKFEATSILMLFNELLSAPKLQLSPATFLEIKTLIDQAIQENQTTNDAHTPFIVSSIFQIILTKLLRLKAANNPFIQSNKHLPQFTKFQSLVEKHCFESRKSSFFADKMGITTKTLNRVTQNIIHKSAKAFINETVILKAKRLMINSEDSFTQIAYKVGFDEPTNFFKYFTKYAGESPSRFKESITN